MKRILFLLMPLLIGFLQPFRTNGQCKIITTSTSNFGPQISGNTIVWSGNDGTTNQIFKFDGTSVTQVSTTSTGNQFPQISGNTIVWSGSLGGVRHIFKFDGTSVTQVSTTSTNNNSPQISGNTIVWSGSLGGVNHIFKFDGTTVTQVSTTSTSNFGPQISGNTIVWQGLLGGVNHIFKFDGTSAMQVSTTSTANALPQIDGNTIVWEGFLGGVRHIFKFDGTTVTQVSTTSTDNSRSQISVNTIVWYGFLGGVQHIFKFDGTTVSQVSTTSTSNFNPQISGNTVVWFGNDGTTTQIYYQSPTSPTIAAGLATSPSICGAADGSIAFTTTNLPDGTYSLSFTATLGATTSPQNVLITGNTFTLTGLKEGTYSNFLITNNSCTTSDATSKTLNNPTTTPSVSISPTAICAGTSPTLTASATNGGSSPHFYWSKNNDPQGISDFINKTTANGLGSNGVLDVYVDNAGIIYAATNGGLAGLSISTNGGTSFTNKTTANGLGDNRVNDVYVDNSGKIYAATYYGLSISTNGGTSFSNKTDANGLGSFYVYGVYVDKNGTIYAATDGGLSISTNGGTSFTNKTTANGLGSNNLNGVYVDNTGAIYAATQGGLSISSNGGTSFTNKTTANGLGGNAVYDVYVDNAGTIYAATNGGLSISSNGGASFSNKPLGSIVRGVYVDNAGTIYVATQGGGVHISTDGGTSFINKTTANGLGTNVVYGIHVGNDGTIYAATASGLGIASQATGNSLAVTNAVAGDVYKVRLVPSAEVCPSPAMAMASVTILTTPTEPITSNSTICSGSTASLSASCASGIVNWYDSNSSTLLATTASFTTPNLTTATTYQVRCESGTCTSGFVAVNVSINPVTAPTGTSNQTICNNTTTSLSASCTSGTVNWYDSNSSTLLATTANYITPNLTTATTYHVRCESGACQSGFVAIVVNINPTATATENMTWNGSVSTNWNDACNWSPNGIPTATNSIVIPNVTNDPVIMSGTTAYAFRIDIGNNASLTINSGGELNVLPTDVLFGISTIYFSNNANLTNNGTLNATSTVNVPLITLANDNSIFNNNGTANLNSPLRSIVMVGSNVMVNNSASGIINLQGGRGIQCINGTTGNIITNQGSMNYTGSDYFAALNPGFTLNNSGTIDIKSGAGIAMQGGTLSNLACARILMPARRYENQVNGSITTNAGLMITGEIRNTNGSFTNNGVLKHGGVSGNAIINNQNSSVIVNNTQPIFTYGGTFDGTINGIFKDAATTTSAGIFTAPNTFVPDISLPVGTQTLYTKITPSGGACNYIVPFTYLNCSPVTDPTGTSNPTICSSASTSLSASCAIGTVNWYDSNSSTLLATTASFTTPNLTSATTYQVRCESGSCKSSFVGVNVTVEAALVANASNSGPYQVGNTIELSASGGDTYAWSGPNSFTSSIQNPIISNAQSVNSGIYSVTITSGGCTATATTNVVVNGMNPCDLVVEYQFVKAGNPYQPLFNLTNGMNINQLTDDVSILVVPVCPTVQIESFNMNIQGTNLNHTITQNVSPYSVFDNIGTSVFGRVLPAGTYTLAVTGYSQDNLQGNILYSKVLTFAILPNSASINTPTLSRSSICGGSNLDVTFSLLGTYNPSNQFKVELSDANGEFESDIILGNTSNIGTYIQPIIIGTSNSAGTINCSIPSSVAGGTNYRIRVISTDGVSVSPISTALTIHPKDLNLISPTDDMAINVGIKQASQKITATNKVNSTANVIYQAGKSITLNAGFEAKAGTVFQAMIGGCGN